jgi:hypothetical protein
MDSMLKNVANYGRNYVFADISNLEDTGLPPAEVLVILYVVALSIS